MKFIGYLSIIMLKNVLNLIFCYRGLPLSLFSLFESMLDLVSFCPRNYCSFLYNNTTLFYQFFWTLQNTQDPLGFHSLPLQMKIHQFIWYPCPCEQRSHLEIIWPMRQFSSTVLSEMTYNLLLLVVKKYRVGKRESLHLFKRKKEFQKKKMLSF